jgi:PAS domain S-box-containing protein
MPQHQTTRVPLCALTVGLALSVFLADLLLPVGVATSIPYIAVVLLAARSAWRGSAPALAALGCTGLIILGWIFALHGSLGWMDVTNRVLGLSTLWIAVYLIHRRQRAEETLTQRGTKLTPGIAPASRHVQADMTACQCVAASPQQRDWLDVALESLGEAVITTDTRLTITFFNQAAENLTGWQAADTYGRPLTSILHLLDEPTRQPVIVPLDQVVQQGTVVGLGEQTLLMRSDGFVRAIAGCATPIRDAQGRVQGLVLVVRDITAPRRVEGQLRQSQKLAAIGTLAGGIAHEFNNVLASIIGFTELTVDDVPPESRAWHNLQKVLQAGLRAKQVVQQLLAFSRQSPPVREPVQLDQIIREALTFLRASLPSTITLQYHGKPGGGAVLADPAQMHQVMMHLGANAADAMREKGGRLEVSLDTVHVLAETADTPYLSPGAYVRLRVRDTGCGIPPEVQERIFEPFFTTKDVGEGTGLGLATVHGIVSGHGGTIAVSSRRGRGTTFTIYLPLRERVAAPAQPPPGALSQEQGCVLMVDDDAMLVQLGCAQLERLGYEAVGCTDSHAALDTFRAAPTRFDLVITDSTMPGMTGVMLAHELQRIRPDLPVILCSGSHESLDRKRATAQGIAAVLPKPWSPQELAHTIQRVCQPSQRRGAACVYADHR